MDWLSAILGQQGGGEVPPSAVGESYLTEMDRLKQQKAMMEALRNRGMRGGNPDQMVGGGSTTSFGERPGILVPGNTIGTALSGVLETAMGQYGANRADKGMGEMAGRNDQEFRAALEKGGFPQGGTGNFPQALPQPQPVQGATPGINGDSIPAYITPSDAGIPAGGLRKESLLKKALSGVVPVNENDPSGNVFGAPVADTSGFLEKMGVHQYQQPEAEEAGAPATPEPEITEPDVAAISASIPASGNMEPMLSGREKWMLQTAHDFPKSAAGMNSMLQAEANTRRDLENAPLKMALAEIRINQAAELAMMKATSQKELEAIKQAQRIELERLRQNGRVDLKKTAAPAKPSTKPATAPSNGSAFNTTLTTMRQMYKDLDKNKGVTNVKNNPVQNVKAWGMSTGPGQILGKALGTKDQSARNTINSSRPLLIRGIAEATGMSAKNIDSNAELKLWLDAASNPSDDLDASMRALDNIEAWVKSKDPKSGSAPAPAPAPAGKTIKREVKLKDGRIGVEYSDGSRGYK